MVFSASCALSIVIIMVLQVSSAPQQSKETPAYPPLGRLVDVGGHLMHIHCTGEGSPTVVLEAGTGGFSFDWSLVQPEVARFTRVCSYDRAGQAWSDLGPRPRTKKQIIYEFHTLLENAKISGPYILVGHSGGGYLVRLYQAQYPGEVVGMVLAECGHENSIFIINGKAVRMRELSTGKPVPDARSDMLESDRSVPLETSKQIEQQMRLMGKSKIESPYETLPPYLPQIRLWAVAQPKHYLADDNPFEAEELAAVYTERHKTEYPLGDIPLLVLHRERGGYKPVPGIITPEVAKQMEEERIENNRDLVRLSRNSAHIIAKNSGHDVHLDRPELVIDAIRQVVEAVRHHTSVKGSETVK